MNRVVIVTGGTRGIGEAIVKKFLASGDFVIPIYLKNTEKAFKMGKEYGEKVFPIQADLSRISECKHVVDTVMAKFRRIDVLVNNVGISSYGVIQDVTEELYYKVMDTNLTSAFFMSKEVVEKMVINHKGKIINISSIWGIYGSSCEVLYSTSKAAMIGLTKSLAKETALSNITVNCIAPGIIETDMLRDLGADAVQTLRSETPLGRLGSPDDIAEMAYFLSTDPGGFMTGQIITIDGGYTL